MHREKDDSSFDEDFLGALRGRDRGRRDRGSRGHQKALQLCRQAQRAIGLALAGECDDDVLRSLYVDAVVPAPDATQLLVRVIIPVHVKVGAEEVYARLERVRPVLRRAVTEAITRKRSPELSFIVTPEVPHE
jgi:ribosome-binding factor A